MIKIDTILEFLAAIDENPRKISWQDGSVSQPCSLQRPLPGGLCFYRPKRWENQTLLLDQVSLLIVGNDSDDIHLKAQAEDSSCSIVSVENPRLAFMKAVTEFFVPKSEPHVHASAVVHETANVDGSCSIGANCSIGEHVIIGAGTVISANVTIDHHCTIGKRCFVAPGASIGQPGFGYERDDKGHLIQFPHIGTVIIGDDVHIGANTCLDRGTLDHTQIGDRVRIDNLCHISHNVVIGEDSAIIANSMIGGSVTIGKGSWVAPSVSIINGIQIGSQTTIGMSSVVTKPVDDDTTVVGSPATPLEDFKNTQRKMKKLLS